MKLMGFEMPKKGADKSLEFDSVKIAKALIKESEAAESRGQDYTIGKASDLIRSMVLNSAKMESVKDKKIASAKERQKANPDGEKIDVKKYSSKRSDGIFTQREFSDALRSIDSKIYSTTNFIARNVEFGEKVKPDIVGAISKFLDFDKIDSKKDKKTAVLYSDAIKVLEKSIENQNKLVQENKEKEENKPQAKKEEKIILPDSFKANIYGVLLRELFNDKSPTKRFQDKLEKELGHESDNFLEKINNTGATTYKRMIGKYDHNIFTSEELAANADVVDLKEKSKDWNKDNDGVGEQGLTLPQLYYALAAAHRGFTEEKDRTELFEEGKGRGHIKDLDIHKINEFLKKKDIQPLDDPNKKGGFESLCFKDEGGKGRAR